MYPGILLNLVIHKLLQTSPAIQALRDAGVTDNNLGEILLTADHYPTHPITTTTTEAHTVEQVKKSQGRDAIQVVYAGIAIRQIVHSELLTEDDLLLVSSLCDQYVEDEQDSQPHYLSNWPLLIVFSVVMVLVVIMLIVPLIVWLAAIPVLLAVSLPKLRYYYHVWLARRGDFHLQRYLKQFDDLLALLSKCLRLIQEAEVVSRGYTRLTALTPASRIERQGAGYQSMVLRQCIVTVCKGLLDCLQQASVNLCSQFPFKLEVADYQQPPLLEEASEDVVSMESLKFLARLVALHNSALLRIISLCLNGELTQHRPLSDLPSVLPMAFLSDTHSTLRQSYEFHRNRVFDRPSSSAHHKNSTRKQSDVNTPLIEELTTMDIRTQMILKRLRDVSEKISEGGTTTDSGTVKDSLMQLECDYHMIQEQCREAIRMTTLYNVTRSSPPHPPENTPPSSSIDQSSGNESSSEEETQSSDEVFEGAATGSENDGDDCSWEEDTKEDREVSIAMMSELRNVLTVRTTNKTFQKVNRPRKARKHKHSKKKGGVQPTTTTQTADNLLTENISQETCDPSSMITHHTSLQCDPGNSDSVIQCDTQDDKLCDTHSNTCDGALCDIHSNTHGNMLEDRDLLLQDANPLFMRQVATMAARIAISQSSHSHQQEEVFGSDEDQ